MADRTRTRLRPDIRREQILAAASEVFGEQEYSSVALETVAERAGVTRGLLHHYFGSKRALFLEVLDRAVRIPAEVRLVPDDASGDLSSVVATSVVSWMRMVETTGGLWAGIADTGGIGGPDVDEVIARARDDLVERMIDELPFPAGLDRTMLRSALRAYAALARTATAEWLVDRNIGTASTEVLLRRTLITLIEDVVPAMGDPGRGCGDADTPDGAA